MDWFFAMSHHIYVTFLACLFLHLIVLSSYPFHQCIYYHSLCLGEITFEEFTDALKKTLKRPISDHEAQAIAKLLDSDNDGKVATTLLSFSWFNSTSPSFQCKRSPQYYYSLSLVSPYGYHFYLIHQSINPFTTVIIIRFRYVRCFNTLRTKRTRWMWKCSRHKSM